MALKNINTLFYLGLLMSFILFLLPSEYKIIVFAKSIYTVILGWSLVFLVILSLLIYFWLLFVDYRKKSFNRLIRRTSFLAAILIASVAYWFYKAYTLGNL